MPMVVYEDIMRADLLCLYFCVCGFREHADPTVAMCSFAFGYEQRGKLVHMFPENANAVEAYDFSTILGGISVYQEGQETLSKMTFYNVHNLENRNVAFLFQTLLLILLALVFVLAYIVYCKVYRYLVPDKTRIARSTMGTDTRASSGEDSLLKQKRVLMLFEIATGAELESRFGLTSTYENYLFIKGMKFASADGIYSNGFVIANDKYVLQTSDYWTIVLIKLLGRQFKHVFVYEISGSTVQQTAKLVYPHTFTFSDLINLNISVLS